MQSMPNLFIASALVILAGCASRPPAETGKHLVYRDASGKPTMQIDYPSAEFCQKVEAVARRDSRCEAKSAENQLHARATLRYNPGDMIVEGHYPDLASCQKANSAMARGVELARPCTAK
jgi:hypothetical protein